MHPITSLAGIVCAGALGIALMGCGGSAAPASSSTGSSTTSASGPAASSAAPASSAAAPASSAPAGSSAAAGSAGSGAVTGQKAPGPYTADGSTTVSGGKAQIQALDSLKWQPNTITATPGEQVSLDIQNGGSTAHDFTSPSLKVSSTAIPAGKTVSVSFTAPSQAGTYQFWCSVPGHAAAGMVGEVIVK